MNELNVKESLKFKLLCENGDDSFKISEKFPKIKSKDQEEKILSIQKSEKNEIVLSVEQLDRCLKLDQDKEYLNMPCDSFV